MTCRLLSGRSGGRPTGIKMRTLTWRIGSTTGLPRIASNKGTPLWPGLIEVYLFGLIDEDAKSIAPGNFERLWGIFRYDWQHKFAMDISGRGQNSFFVPAQNMRYQEKWCRFNPNAKDLSKLGKNINNACTFRFDMIWTLM
ncbi:putative glucan endo-1,3-beta-D-glucosidase [Helianthus debilis subsp. tardiflorus]